MNDYNTDAQKLEDPKVSIQDKLQIISSIRSNLANSRPSTSLLQSKIPYLLIALTSDLKVSEDTLNSILHCFCNITVCDEDGYNILIKAGLQAVALNFLKKSNSNRICEKALWITANLAANSQAATKSLLYDGVMDRILELYQTKHNDSELESTFAWCLCTILKQVDVRQQFDVTPNIAKALKMLIENHKDQKTLTYAISIVKRMFHHPDCVPLIKLLDKSGVLLTVNKTFLNIKDARDNIYEVYSCYLQDILRSEITLKYLETKEVFEIIVQDLNSDWEGLPIKIMTSLLEQSEHACEAFERTKTSYTKLAECMYNSSPSIHLLAVQLFKSYLEHANQAAVKKITYAEARRLIKYLAPSLLGMDEDGSKITAIRSIGVLKILKESSAEISSTIYKQFLKAIKPQLSYLTRSKPKDAKLQECIAEIEKMVEAAKTQRENLTHNTRSASRRRDIIDEEEEAKIASPSKATKKFSRMSSMMQVANEGKSFLRSQKFDLRRGRYLRDGTELKSGKRINTRSRSARSTSITDNVKVSRGRKSSKPVIMRLKRTHTIEDAIEYTNTIMKIADYGRGKRTHPDIDYKDSLRKITKA